MYAVLSCLPSRYRLGKCIDSYQDSLDGKGRFLVSFSSMFFSCGGIVNTLAGIRLVSTRAALSIPASECSTFVCPNNRMATIA